MKDSYSFDRDPAAMDERYELHVGAYDRMMERTGLRFYRVEGDVGMMGGVGAHEYMAPCAAGEDEIVLADGLRRQRRGRAERSAGRARRRRVRHGRRAADGRAGDRDRQHLQARHPLLRALGARYLDETGAEQPVWMASYGIGPARIVAAAVEQFADEHGISWPRSLAPFAVHLVALGKPGTPERDAADALYATLCEGGVEVLYDDRDLGPGEKFADAELLGCPLRLTVGRRSLESGEIEVQLRRGREQARRCPWRASPRSSARRWTSCGRASPRATRRRA